MTSSSSLLLVCAILTLAASCHKVCAARTRAKEASVGTFNTFLFRSAPGFQERKELLIKRLQGKRSSPPDVLCLQEVFRRSDAKDIVEALRSQYPYHASFQDLDAEPVPQPACTPEEAGTAALCLSENCADVPEESLQNCTYVECGVLFTFPQACQTCLATEFGAAEDAQLDSFSRCASIISASEYAVPYGLLLLSRYPLSNIITSDYLDPPFVFPAPRGYITAQINAIRRSVLCTHLTTNVSDYFGPPQFSSWDEQQANEVKVIHEVVENTSSIILLGDFNHGPATPGITWRSPINFGLMTARGLFSANALWCGQCTYCTDNILTGGTFPNYLIDHIYLPTSRASDIIRVESLFGGDIRTDSGLPLSDHYGAMALINTRRHRGSTEMCPGSDVLGTNADFLDLDDIDSHIETFCPAYLKLNFHKACNSATLRNTHAEHFRLKYSIS